MVDDVTVRDLEDGDRPAWGLLRAVYLEHYGQELPPEVTDETWRRVAGGHPQVHGIGAMAGGRLVGVAHYVLGPSTWHRGDDCYLEDLVVDPQERGRGVGRQLIQELVRRGEAGGWRRVHWLTEESNVTARRLYDHVGELTAYVRYEIQVSRSTTARTPLTP